MMFVIQSQEGSENIFPGSCSQLRNRIDFRRIGRQENPPDIVRNADLSAVTPSRTIQDKKEVFLFMTAARFLKENLPAKTIHMRKDQGIQSPVTGGSKSQGFENRSFGCGD